MVPFSVWAKLSSIRFYVEPKGHCEGGGDEGETADRNEGGWHAKRAEVSLGYYFLLRQMCFG